MERPKATIEPARDEFDHELTPVQADFIALTDTLLEHRDESTELTFVDIAVECSATEVLERLEQTRFGLLVAAPDEQMAIETDGSYYPILDLRKSEGQLTGVGVRAWGWEDKKIRYEDTDAETAKYPRQYRKYPGEIDKIRELDISFGYTIGDQHVVETIQLYGSTSQPDYVTASRNFSCMAYSETGYEGHGRKSMPDITDQDIYDFLDIVAETVGDTPKSRGEKISEELTEFNERWIVAGYGSELNELIRLTWPAQAHYELSGRRYKTLDGATIMESVDQDSASCERVKEAIDATLKVYRQRKAMRDQQQNS